MQKKWRHLETHIKRENSNKWVIQEGVLPAPQPNKTEQATWMTSESQRADKRSSNRDVTTITEIRNWKGIDCKEQLTLQ